MQLRNVDIPCQNQQPLNNWFVVMVVHKTLMFLVRGVFDLSVYKLDGPPDQRDGEVVGPARDSRDSA